MRKKLILLVMLSMRACFAGDPIPFVVLQQVVAVVVENNHDLLDQKKPKYNSQPRKQPLQKNQKRPKQKMYKGHRSRR